MFISGARRNFFKGEGPLTVKLKFAERKFSSHFCAKRFGMHALTSLMKLVSFSTMDSFRLSCLLVLSEKLAV